FDSGENLERREQLLLAGARFVGVAPSIVRANTTSPIDLRGLSISAHWLGADRDTISMGSPSLPPAGLSPPLKLEGLLLAPSNECPPDSRLSILSLPSDERQHLQHYLPRTSRSLRPLGIFVLRP